MTMMSANLCRRKVGTKRLTYSHRSLEELLKRYLPENLGLQFQADANQLEELANEVANTEAR